MIHQWVTMMGPWSWLVLAAVLLVAELMLPGIFLIWVGIAAGLVWALSMMFWDSASWTWEMQWGLFALFSVAAVLAGRKVVLRSGDSDQPDLNDRGASLLGRTTVLKEPIREGRGRVHLDDTVWVAEGPDAEAGTRVKVIAARGSILTVERA